jgi:hypothetical protein
MRTEIYQRSGFAGRAVAGECEMQAALAAAVREALDGLRGCKALTEKDLR